jgi:hypothetical protein
MNESLIKQKYEQRRKREKRLDFAKVLATNIAAKIMEGIVAQDKVNGYTAEENKAFFTPPEGFREMDGSEVCKETVG